ncbi:uncharacterized protein LOC134232170 [Saccostrea cucullata]|uniref:uncharacterized protein LOC134232170 n=1 Tax=Saccostrea cuccullata TaxID=36930 RepID=UPI002ED3BA16
METGKIIFFATATLLQIITEISSAVIPSTCIKPSAISILQNPCDDHVDKVKPAAENRTLNLIGQQAGDLRVHTKSALDIVNKERYHSPNPDLTILFPESVQDVSTNTTQIKHTMESVFLYVDQMINREKKLQIKSEIPDILCNINRIIVKILCNLYRMGATEEIALQDRAELIKASVKVPSPHYNFTFKELFQRFHGFLCELMKHGGVQSSQC